MAVLMALGSKGIAVAGVVGAKVELLGIEALELADIEATQLADIRERDLVTLGLWDVGWCPGS